MNSEEVERYRRCLLRQEQSGGSWENGPIVFRGRKGQRGFGFGSFLSSVGRFALPFVKNIGKKVFKHAVEVGKDVIIHGKKPKEALKTRGKALVSDILTQGQSGSGLRSSRKRCKRTSTKWISNKYPKRA